MKMGRVIVAGIVGGIVIFAWSACVHMFLMKDSFMKPLPNAAVMEPALKAGLTETGWYIYPPINKDASPEEKKAWMEKAKSNPHGIVIHVAEGEEMMGPRQFGIEFVSGLLAALIGAAIIASAGGGAGRGLMVGLGGGLFAWLAIDVSYWNWDHFPDGLLVQELVEQGAGWMTAGLLMGAIVGKSARVTAAV